MLCYSETDKTISLMGKVKLKFEKQEQNIILLIKLRMNKEVSEALEKVGNHGRYQTIIGIILFLTACEVNMLFFGPTFIYMNPSFNCSFTNGQVDESVACPRMNECTITHDFTLTAALQLYCDKQIIRTIIQSTFAVGAVVGLLTMNYISDTHGRLLGTVIPQFICILGVCLTLLGGWIESIPIIIVSQFVSGMGSFGIITSSYIIPGEFCQDSLRVKMTVQLNYAGFTTIMIGVLYFHYNIWYKYLIVFLLIPFILILIATMYYMVESPFFLHQEGRWEEYLESLKVIASYNNTQFDEKQIMERNKEFIQTPQEKLPFLQVICDPYYLKLIGLLSLMSIGIQVFCQGRSFTLDLAGWEYGYNCILTGAAQAVADFILSQMVNSIPRKKGVIISTSVLIAFGLIFLSQDITDDPSIQMIFFGINCIIGTFVFTAILLYASQLIPSKISATSFGIIDAVGQIGVFMAPFIVTFCNNRHIFPLVLLAGLQFIFILFPIFFVDGSRFNKHHQEQGFGIEEEKQPQK